VDSEPERLTGFALHVTAPLLSPHSRCCVYSVSSRARFDPASASPLSLAACCSSAQAHGVLRQRQIGRATGAPKAGANRSAVKDGKSAAAISASTAVNSVG